MSKIHDSKILEIAEEIIDLFTIENKELLRRTVNTHYKYQEQK